LEPQIPEALLRRMPPQLTKTCGHFDRVHWPLDRRAAVCCSAATGGEPAVHGPALGDRTLPNEWSAEELLRQHPDLRPEEVYAALADFDDHVEELVPAMQESAVLAEAARPLRSRAMNG